ncbi:helix-turn-helix transcriptional regulator [Enterococcus sp. AZ101]|uniref:helix-turn-helix transcriptional regulator n=1 Tax=Enterococcus sp. AZ101 TaxID=2774742 RepID=UPI003D29E0ED
MDRTITNLAKMRRKASLTIDDLARLVSTSKQTIMKLESGAGVQLNIMLRISVIFDVPVEELLQPSTIDEKKQKPLNDTITVNIVKEMRAARKLSQPQLAEKIGISKQAIINVEKRFNTHEVSYSIAKKIANGLGFNISDLFFIVDKDLPSEQLETIVNHRTSNLLEKLK